MLAQYRNRMALGIDFVCRCAGQSTHVEVMSPGAFSASDALCAIAICGAFGVTPARPLATLAPPRCRAVLRSCRVCPGAPSSWITATTVSLADQRLRRRCGPTIPHRLICVFGSVGGRTPGPPPRTGRRIRQPADYTVITSDNPGQRAAGGCHPRHCQLYAPGCPAPLHHRPPRGDLCGRKDGTARRHRSVCR